MIDNGASILSGDVNAHVAIIPYISGQYMLWLTMDWQYEQFIKVRKTSSKPLYKFVWKNHGALIACCPWEKY